MQLKFRKPNSIYFDYEVTITSGNTTIEEEMTEDELMSIHDTILGEINYNNYDRWIESIKDDIERAGYKLVKVD